MDGGKCFEVVVDLLFGSALTKHDISMRVAKAEAVVFHILYTADKKSR